MILVMIMKLNNKGLTMIELIVTIGVMVLIGIVISTNMLGILSNQEDKEYDTFVKEIEDSACMYVETAENLDRSACIKSGCTVSINDLINAGYLDKNLKDPSNGKFIKENPDNYIVKVSWGDNVKTCKIKS